MLEYSTEKPVFYFMGYRSSIKSNCWLCLCAYTGSSSN